MYLTTDEKMYILSLCYSRFAYKKPARVKRFEVEMVNVLRDINRELIRKLEGRNGESESNRSTGVLRESIQ